MFISKNIDNLKGFNTKYDMYYEDVDLCFRAKKINLDCYVIDSTFIQHNVSHSFNFFKFKKMFKKFISMNKFIFSNNNFIISILILLYHLIMIPIYFVLYIVIIILR